MIIMLKFNNSEVSWDDVVANCDYDFAEKAIKMCLRISYGDPTRKRFIGLIRNGFDQFKRVSIFFRKKYVNVELHGGNSVEDIGHVKSKFTSDIEVKSWRDGLTILIRTEQQFKEFVALDDRLEYM